MKKVYTYHKINPARREWLGDRYFKCEANYGSDSVIQVVRSVGETKKGRGHTFGVYLISRMTFFSNYLAMGYAIPCTQKEYESKLKEVILCLI